MGSEEYSKLKIKSWAEEDRPREKLSLKGRTVLSNAELIALLIGSGNKKESAVELSRRILNSVDNNLHELGKLQLNDLRKYKGIGSAKAIAIIASLELGRRRKAAEVLKPNRVSCSSDGYEIVQPLFADLQHEEFWILLLNKANHLISRVRISKGGVSGTVADTRIIFRKAIEDLASSIILCHNHPSGNLKPSEADKRLTDKLLKTGEILGIPILDHIILSDHGYYSFADEGLI